MATTAVRLALLGAALASSACGGGTPLVSAGPHPADGPPPVVVHDPPPPTKVEIVPLRRNQECFWKGGYWTPRAGSWRWVKGTWVLPAPGCTLAPAVTHFEAVEGSTVLVHRAELWYRTDGAEACEAPKDCSDL